MSFIMITLLIDFTGFGQVAQNAQGEMQGF